MDKRRQSSSTSQELVHFRKILRAKGVLSAADYGRKEFKENERSHREKRWEWVSHLCEFTSHLRRNPEDLQVFFQAPFWSEKPHAPKEKNLPRLVAMYMVGTSRTEGNRYELARSYGHLVDLLLARQIEADKVFRFLQRAKGVKSALKLLSGQSHPMGSKSATTVIVANSSDNVETAVFPSQSATGGGAEAPRKMRSLNHSSIPKFDLSNDMLLGAGPMLCQVLDVPVRGVFRLTCERLENDENGFQRFKVKKFN